MKYNRKAVIAAIVKIQKEKFETEKKELEAKEPDLEGKVKQAAANFILGLSAKEIIKGLKNPEHGLDVLDNDDGSRRVSMWLSVNGDSKSKLFRALNDACDEYHGLKRKLFTINHYLCGHYRNGGTNLSEKVRTEVPYDYELQADELINNPEFATDIETLRKQIFKD